MAHTPQIREAELDSNVMELEDALANFTLLEAQTDAKIAQNEQQMAMREQELVSGQIQLAQQQARLTGSEHWLCKRKTTLQGAHLDLVGLDCNGNGPNNVLVSNCWITAAHMFLMLLLH